MPLRARISERLGHSGPTVSQTVARMERDGLVVVSGDRTSSSRPPGRSKAVHVMRKHRLAERLLADVIGLDWEYVHDEACRWEHVMSEQVERRLIELLGQPARVARTATRSRGSRSSGVPPADTFMTGRRPRARRRLRERRARARRRPPPRRARAVRPRAARPAASTRASCPAPGRRSATPAAYVLVQVDGVDGGARAAQRGRGPHLRRRIMPDHGARRDQNVTFGPPSRILERVRRHEASRWNRIETAPRRPPLDPEPVTRSCASGGAAALCRGAAEVYVLARFSRRRPTRNTARGAARRRSSPRRHPATRTSRPRPAGRTETASVDHPPAPPRRSSPTSS